MFNRRSTILAVIAAAAFSLALPVIAAAQGGYYDPYGRNRDDRRDNRRYDDYNQRILRDAVRRVENRSDNFKGRIDSALDRSRYDGSRREDRINEVADRFHEAAERLEDRFDNGRNLNRSADEARTLLQLGTQIDRFVSRNAIDGRAQNEWAQIRQDLRVIANAYGIRSNAYDNDNDYRNRRGSVTHDAAHMVNRAFLGSCVLVAFSFN